MNRSIFMPSLCIAVSAALSLMSACVRNESVKQPPPPAPPSAAYAQKLSTDGLFAFGKADLEDFSDSGRAQLDALAARLLSGPDIKIIHVIGHSDRIGNDQANLKLSTRRANSVRDYLIERGIAVEKIMAVGRGSVEPVVECDPQPRQALIACLAPNRRVEIRIIPGP